MRILSVFACALIASVPLYGAEETTVKRGRNEGTASIPASNVMGNGNITLFLDLGGSISRQELSGDVIVGGQIGIAEIMQIVATASAINYQELGPAEAHLRITTPGNDKLRFFGLGISGDLYLSTSQDTVSRDSDPSKPLYSPFLLPSVVADLDWLAREKQLPLKTYLNVDLVDDPQLLYRYNQLAVTLGSEWKTYQHSLFVDLGLSLYKEKPNKLNQRGDSGFEQMYGWLKPGGRYRIRNRFSLVGSLGITFFQALSTNTAIVPRVLDLSVQIEAPLVFRETNAEAIRTLVFMEQKEQQESDEITRNVQSGQNLIGDLGSMLEGLEGTEQTFDYSKERKELANRRKEIQRKMEEIEKILDEIE